MYEYENIRRVTYNCDEHGKAHFIPVCEKCARFVKPNETIKINIDGDLKTDEPNATCSKCGPTKMLFEGYY